MDLQWEYHYKDLKGSPQVKFDSNSIEIMLKDQSRVRVVPFDSLVEARVRRSLLSLSFTLSVLVQYIVDQIVWTMHVLEL